MTAEDASDLAAQEVIESKKDQDEGSEKKSLENQTIDPNEDIEEKKRWIYLHNRIAQMEQSLKKRGKKVHDIFEQ